MSHTHRQQLFILVTWLVQYIPKNIKALTRTMSARCKNDSSGKFPPPGRLEGWQADSDKLPPTKVPEKGDCQFLSHQVLFPSLAPTLMQKRQFGGCPGVVLSCVKSKYILSNLSGPVDVLQLVRFSNWLTMSSCVGWGTFYIWVHAPKSQCFS